MFGVAILHGCVAREGGSQPSHRGPGAAAPSWGRSHPQSHWRARSCTGPADAGGLTSFPQSDLAAPALTRRRFPLRAAAVTAAGAEAEPRWAGAPWPCQPGGPLGPWSLAHSSQSFGQRRAKPPQGTSRCRASVRPPALVGGEA